MTTSTPSPPPLTLAEVYGLVTCTPGDGISLLNSLAESQSDRNPGLVNSINEAIAQLMSMTATAAEEAAEEKPEY